MIKKRHKFYFPEEDNHFDGNDYQVPHRSNSLKHVKKFDVAIDVGAHVGTWAVDLVKKFKQTICFEPIKEHRDCLVENLKELNKHKIGDYIIYDYVLGDKKQDKVYLSYSTEGNSGTASVSDDGKYHAEMITFDSCEYESIDYLKVDVEGFELQFLKGAEETLKRTRPVMNMEIKRNCERFGISRQEIYSFITDKLGMICIDQTVNDYVFIHADR